MALVKCPGKDGKECGVAVATDDPTGLWCPDHGSITLPPAGEKR